MQKPDHKREASALRYSEQNYQLQSHLAAPGCGIPIIVIQTAEDQED